MTSGFSEVAVGTGFALMMSGILIADFSVGKMLERVNRDRTNGTTISPYGWYADKTWKVVSLYRSVEPKSKLMRNLTIGTGLLMLGFITLAAGLVKA